MTEKQIKKIMLSIKRHRAALVAEKRKFGGFDDSGGRRYYISDLYLKIADYKGALTYKKWFDKNFPDDIGGPFLSLNWSVAFFELGQIMEAKIYTVDTAFQNVYFHGLILDKVVDRIDMYENGFETLDYAKSCIKDCNKLLTKPYLDWLSNFIDSDEYKVTVNKYIALSKLLKDENNRNKRIILLDHIRDLKTLNKNKLK
jgi:hypothetical protein